jgi:hypothetical protein
MMDDVLFDQRSTPNALISDCNGRSYISILGS